MTKLSIGLLAAVALALATAPADAAKKKSSKAKKDKAEVSQAHPMGFTCTLNALAGAKQPAACGGK